MEFVAHMNVVFEAHDEDTALEATDHLAQGLFEVEEVEVEKVATEDVDPALEVE